MSLALTSSAGNEPASIQWTLAYVPTDVASITVTAGPAASAAGKTLSCSTGSGTYTCVAYGVNSTIISNGILATLNLTMAAGVSNSSVAVNNAVAASPSGHSLTLTSTGGTVTAPAIPLTVSTIGCVPASLGPNASSTCTVTLNQAAPATAALVSLTNTNIVLTVPASLTVAANATSGTFKATTGTVSSSQSATVTATLNSVSASTTISLVPPVTPTSLSCAPASLGPNASSTCTVTLNQSAPAGGSLVSLTNTGTALTVPASLTVGAGATSGTFSATTGTIGSTQSATVTATLNSVSASATISLVPPVTPTSLSCAPASLGSNASSSCTVTLNQAAPAGGALVTLGNTNTTALAVPASTTIAAGAASGTFNATTSTVAGDGNATITATLNGVSQPANISLVAPITVSTLSCSPTALNANGSSTCTVTLSKNAASGGTTVSLTSSNAMLTAPASLMVPGGTTVGSVSVQEGAPPTNQTATFSASLNGSSQSVTLSLGASLQVTSLVCNPTSLTSNSTSTCTVTLSQSVAANTTVSLTSNSGKITVPASVIVLAGSASAGFSANIGSIGKDTSGAITAKVGSTSQSATLTLLATPTLLSLTCNPTHLTVGSSSTCTVTLSNSAGAAVKVNSTNSAISVPTTTTAPQGTSTATFTATAHNFVAGWIAVSATFNGATKSLVFTIAQPSSATSSSISQSSSLHGISCASRTLTIGSHEVCQITLNGVTGASVAEVHLSTSSPSIKVPATIVTGPGQWSTDFQVDALAPGTDEAATITAQLGSDTVTGLVEIHADQRPSFRVPAHLFATPGAEVRFQASGADTGVTFSAAGLPSGASLNPISGVFDWVPGANQLGAYDIAFTATGARGAMGTQLVKLEVGSGAPSIVRVTNGASHSGTAVCSSGAVATLEGGWLTQDTTASDPSGNSLQLSGTIVRVNGNTVPVLYASPERVDFQCPESASGSILAIVIETAQGASRPVEIVSKSLTPSIFSADESGSGQGIVTHAGNSDLAMVRNYRYTARPARAGDRLVIYATGINDSMMRAFVRIRGIEIAADSITRAPLRAGVWQLSFVLPENISPGEAADLSITCLLWDGTAVTSNTTTIAIEN